MSKQIIETTEKHTHTNNTFVTYAEGHILLTIHKGLVLSVDVMYAHLVLYYLII